MKNKVCSCLLACLLPISVVAFAFSLSGCVAVVAGGAAAGATAYTLGDLSVPVQASPAELARAIELGGKDIGLSFISGAGDETAGEYLFRNAEDRRITVKYRRKSPVYLEMSIRVGTFGDEPVAMSLNEAIQKRL
jgi:hypothetical protein